MNTTQAPAFTRTEVLSRIAKSAKAGDSFAFAVGLNAAERALITELLTPRGLGLTKAGHGYLICSL